MILDFPCNQFGNQATRTVDEIQSFCELNYFESGRGKNKGIIIEDIITVSLKRSCCKTAPYNN